MKDDKAGEKDDLAAKNSYDDMASPEASAPSNSAGGDIPPETVVNSGSGNAFGGREDSDDRGIPEKDEKKGRGFALEAFDYIEIFVFSVCAVILVFTFVLRLCRVDGPSMRHTLEDGEVLIVSDIYYTPERGDIVVFHQTGNGVSAYNKPIVKRVIATAGQYVKIDYDAGLVYVSDDDIYDVSELLEESGYVFLDGGRWDAYGTLERYVPEGYIFVMGDNRNHSDDSRVSAIGLVDTRRVFGRVIFRILPLAAAGNID